jgi:adenylate cyclase
VPGAILVDEIFYSGSLDDMWQARLRRLMRELTGDDLSRPIVTFATNINRWQSRNLALRLIVLGYKEVYWYRGGWESWNAHDLPLAPLVMQLRN